MRVLIAGVVGSIAMFIWASIAHVATPLASVGLHPVPHEADVMARMEQNLGTKGGLYFLPYSAPGTMPAASAAPKLNALIAYTPPRKADMTSQLVIEYVLELIESVLAAIVLAAVASRFGARLGVAVAVGLIAAVSTNFSYWNWYGFGLDYTLANGVTELLKYVFAGVAIALVLGWRRKTAATAG